MSIFRKTKYKLVIKYDLNGKFITIEYFNGLGCNRRTAMNFIVDIVSRIVRSRFEAHDLCIESAKLVSRTKVVPLIDNYDLVK